MAIKLGRRPAAAARQIKEIPGQPKDLYSKGI
jgi:hypothetical protein